MPQGDCPHEVDDDFTPQKHTLTDNEWQWIKVIRIICNGEVPAPDFDTGVPIRRFLRIDGETKH
jgi:hypothetical protein